MTFKINAKIVLKCQIKKKRMNKWTNGNELTDKQTNELSEIVNNIADKKRNMNSKYFRISRIRFIADTLPNFAKAWSVK